MTMTLRKNTEEILKHINANMKDNESIESARQFLDELDKILPNFINEAKIELSYFDSKANPREIAEKITSGEIPPRFIGEKNEMVLRQEIFSLLNTKPLFRESSFENELFGRVLALREISPVNYQNILDEIRQKFSDVERAIQAWETRGTPKEVKPEEHTPETKDGEI